MWRARLFPRKNPRLMSTIKLWGPCVFAVGSDHNFAVCRRLPSRQQKSGGFGARFCLFESSGAVMLLWRIKPANKSPWPTIGQLTQASTDCVSFACSLFFLFFYV
nr:hypothetical protein [Pandoravirus aubagnensis]